MEKRNAYGVSQKRLALMAGISREHLNRIEAGKVHLTNGMKLKLLEALERFNPEAPLFLLFDYVRIRFPTLDIQHIIKDVLKLNINYMLHMPTQTAYAVHSAKEKAKSSVSDFRRGIVQEQQSRQTGRMEKQEQHRQSIADKRMELQKAQEAKQSGRKADGSATAGATRTRVHDRPVTASAKDKSQTTSEKRERPATSGTVRTEQTKTPAVKERPLSSGTNVRNPENTTQRQTIRHTEIQTSQKERVNTRQTVHQARFTEKSKQKQQTVKQIQKIKKGRIK